MPRSQRDQDLRDYLAGREQAGELSERQQQLLGHMDTRERLEAEYDARAAAWEAED